MSVRQSLLFFSLAAFAVAGTASAQDRDQTFQERDRNNDGVLTQSEYGGHPGNFRSLDTDGDGVLSYQEFVRRGGRVDDGRVGNDGGDRHWGFADPFAVMDRNNDGVISVNEWRGPIRDFRDMDVNDDRKVTRAEFRSLTGQFDPTVRQRFDVLDRNDDGQLSRREAMLRNADFRRADLNDNGVLTLGEFANAAPMSSGGVGSFSALDRNNDNRISYWEWRGERQTFDRLDRNNDRELSRAEFDNRPVVYGGPAVEDFRGLDRNGDGVLSRSESRMSSYEFDRADVNNDGVLTLKEYSNTNTTSDNDQFDVLDRNNDGTVSRWEWNGNRDDFDRMDRNGDGVLSRSEFDRRSSGGFLGSILGRVEDVRFNDLDLNNDGVLTTSEWRGSRSEFDRLDTNNDGVLNAYEFTR